MKKEYDLSKLKKRETVKSSKSAVKTPVSVRIDGSVLAKIKEEAHKRGIPYQTLIGSVLFQYANNELIEKRFIDIFEAS